MPNAIPIIFKACFMSCAGVAAALGSMGCGGSSGPGVILPSAVVLPARPTPSATEVSVSRGSTAGGTEFKIKGSNLTRGSSVTFGDVKVISISYNPRDEPGATLFITSPPHPAGLVDLVISTGDGIVRMTGAFEFVAQDAFDFNGRWGGFTTDGSDVWIEFVIRNNTLVSGSCEGYATKTAVLPTDVTTGSFVAQGPDHFQMTGRIVSAEQAAGRVTGPDCRGAAEIPWHADKLN